MTAAPVPQLIQARDAICASIKDALPTFDVASHHGRFSDEEMKRFGANAPAVRVALLALAEPLSSGEGYVDYLATIGIYVATKDGAVIGDRDASALCAVECITLMAFRARWGLGSIFQAARSAGAQNLYSAGGAADGFALWAIDLRQPLRLQTADDSAQMILRAWVGVAPNIGPDHRDDYVQLGQAPGQAPA